MRCHRSARCGWDGTMTLLHVIGLDHVVVAVRDLDAAEAAWTRLGFTVSPRGTHSAQLGSGNHTIVLGADYIELIGVLAPTAHNAPMRAFLERREGVERLAFAAKDAAAGAAELRGRGIAAVGPIQFGRPVTLPDGTVAEARFNVVQWPPEERPGGLRIFACEHLTPQHVWIPALQAHPNAAARLVRLEILAADPAAAARHMAGLLDGAAMPEPDGAWRVPTGPGRADLLFLDRAALAARHADVAPHDLPADGASVLVLGTRDASATARALGLPQGAPLIVPADAASGIMLRFLPV